MLFIKKYKLLLLILLVALFLRTYRLSSISLFGDELDVGYHAYSLLETGRDYSGNFLPLQPRSLAEWRTPLFIYSTIPTVALFGINALGVRLLPAIFGVLNIYLIFYLFKLLNTKNKKIFNIDLEYFAALFMAINPWHIQYSRAAFEVTQMLAFLLLGIIFLLNSFKTKGRQLWLSMFFFMLMPWTYNTPKLFVPLFLFSLFLLFFREIFKFEKNNLFKALIAGLVLGLPLLFNIFSGQGSARFSNISLFSDPNLENIISETREFDSSNSRIYHNKITYFSSRFAENYLSSFSPGFLFFKGDHNLRHSINNYGQFYVIEVVTLILGLVYLFGIYENKRHKYILACWFLIAPIPSALTIDGATHATRLILMLPALVILDAFGFYYLYKISSKYFVLAYLLILLISFAFYQHAFWIHNRQESSRWWHSGWQESVSYIKENKQNYKKILISTKGEPPWIFYAAYSQLDPNKFQQFSPETTTDLESFGQVSFIDNVYFTSINNGSLYEWGSLINKDTLYLATAEEVSVDLVAEPDRTPDNLNLLKSVSYPNGLPAYYIFSGK